MEDNEEEINIKLLNEWGNLFEEEIKYLSELIIDSFKENPEVINVLNILLPQVAQFKRIIRTRNNEISHLEKKIQELEKKLEEK